MTDTKKNKTVLVGLSGGVDSSTALYLLKQQGYSLIGATMEIFKGQALAGAGTNSCYGREKTDIGEIRALCEKLEVPFYVFDCSAEFSANILSYFKSEYLRGRTPNPCIKCNELIKFSLLPAKATAAGLKFDYFATGHYARIVREGNGHYYLRQAADKAKDQSYFLYRLGYEALAGTLFPLGDIKAKADTRAIAKDALGEDLATKHDSQDFYGGAYTDLLDTPPKTGNIVLDTGEILGTHQGFWNYTIGQRKGLHLGHSCPLFVKELRPSTNEVIVSESPPTDNIFAVIEDYFFCPYNYDAITAKVRSTGKQEPVKRVELNAKDKTATVHFTAPIKAGAKGQSLVLYQGDLVIGGGIIA